ncbi:protein of unknown function [Candidatus Methylomirabilis oxygeniifera]|uniref:Uncharacterized protein n=1 Tax=Methylomirabilis oxygeniifera TaxID=671143 RepID=D5MJG3_METO1|nr:protein of unknown function [Candidatus Methylomirabilis oxyfera]
MSLSRLFTQVSTRIAPCHVKHALKHRLGQPADLGILLAGVLRSDQHEIIPEDCHLPMSDFAISFAFASVLYYADLVAASDSGCHVAFTHAASGMT